MHNWRIAIIRTRAGILVVRLKRNCNGMKSRVCFIQEKWFESMTSSSLCTLFYGTDYKLQIIRYVDGTPTSEVTPVTICYIHPPHHGCPYVMVMVINDRLASLSFHANQPSQSSNKAISNFELQGVDKDLGHIAHPVSNRCTSFWFHINWTKHSWDLSNRVLDLEKTHPKKRFPAEFLKNLIR